jgi:hypothetical protein
MKEYNSLVRLMLSSADLLQFLIYLVLSLDVTRVLLGTQKSMDKIAQKKLNNGMYLFMKIGKLQ